MKIFQKLAEYWDRAVNPGALYSRNFVKEGYVQTGEKRLVEAGGEFAGKGLYRKVPVMLPYLRYCWYRANPFHGKPDQFTLTEFIQHKNKGSYECRITDTKIHETPLKTKEGRSIFSRAEIIFNIKEFEERLIKQGYTESGKWQPPADRLAANQPKPA